MQCNGNPLWSGKRQAASGRRQAGSQQFASGKQKTASKRRHRKLSSSLRSKTWLAGIGEGGPEEKYQLVADVVVVVVGATDTLRTPTAKRAAIPGSGAWSMEVPPKYDELVLAMRSGELQMKRPQSTQGKKYITTRYKIRKRLEY